MMKFPIDVFEFEDLAYKEISITMRHFRISYMNHVIIDIEIQLKQKNSFKTNSHEIIHFQTQKLIPQNQIGIYHPNH